MNKIDSQMNNQENDKTLLLEKKVSTKSAKKEGHSHSDPHEKPSSSLHMHSNSCEHKSNESKEETHFEDHKTIFLEKHAPDLKKKAGHSHSHKKNKKLSDDESHVDHNKDDEEHKTFFSRNKDTIFKVVGLIQLIYSLAEIVIASIIGSLTLLSDGFHNLGDVFAVAIAHYASKYAEFSPTNKFSFGYRRAEILGAFINGLFLLSLSIYIVLEALPKFINPEGVRGDNREFMIIAGIGLFLNTIGTILFGLAGTAHSHSHGGHSHGGHSGEDLNVKAVFLHYLGDTIASVFVLATGLILFLSHGAHWSLYIDPASSLVIVIFIIATSFPLVKKCLLILLQKTPDHLDLEVIKKKLMTIKGVLAIHDLHCWELIESVPIASAHIVCSFDEFYTSKLKIQEETSLKPITENKTSLLSHLFDEYSDFEEKMIREAKKVFHEHGLHSTTIQLEKQTIRSSVFLEYCKRNCTDDCFEDWCCDKTKKKELRKRKNIDRNHSTPTLIDIQGQQ